MTLPTTSLGILLCLPAALALCTGCGDKEVSETSASSSDSSPATKKFGQSCQSSTDCLDGLTCSGADFAEVKSGDTDGRCFSDEATARARLASWHKRNENASATLKAIAAPETKSCAELPDARLYVIEDNWATGARSSSAGSSSHYITTGVPRELNDGSLVKPTQAELRNTALWIDHMMKQPWFVYLTEDEFLMTSVDVDARTYTPGFVKGWAWVVDAGTGKPLCQAPFAAKSPAEAVTTMAPHKDFQSRATKAVKASLGKLSPSLAPLADKFLKPNM